MKQLPTQQLLLITLLSDGVWRAIEAKIFIHQIQITADISAQLLLEILMLPYLRTVIVSCFAIAIVRLRSSCSYHFWLSPVALGLIRPKLWRGIDG
jgi:hypothetical protein